MKNIVLIGFMGTGKTWVGKELAKILGFEYLSTDDTIVDREKTSISDIFEKQGEKCFRELERELVKEISKKEKLVIDSGGGIILNSDNVLDLKKNGFIVCLVSDPEEIYKRVKKHSHRPLLKVDDPLAKIKELLDKRKPYYEIADYYIQTDNLSLDDICQSIKNAYKKQN